MPASLFLLRAAAISAVALAVAVLALFPQRTAGAAASSVLPTSSHPPCLTAATASAAARGTRRHCNCGYCPNASPRLIKPPSTASAARKTRKTGAATSAPESRIGEGGAPKDPIVAGRKRSTVPLLRALRGGGSFLSGCRSGNAFCDGILTSTFLDTCLTAIVRAHAALAAGLWLHREVSVRLSRRRTVEKHRGNFHDCLKVALSLVDYDLRTAVEDLSELDVFTMGATAALVFTSTTTQAFQSGDWNLFGGLAYVWLPFLVHSLLNIFLPLQVAVYSEVDLSCDVRPLENSGILSTALTVLSVLFCISYTRCRSGLAPTWLCFVEEYLAFPVVIVLLMRLHQFLAPGTQAGFYVTVKSNKEGTFKRAAVDRNDPALVGALLGRVVAEWQALIGMSVLQLIFVVAAGHWKLPAQKFVASALAIASAYINCKFQSRRRTQARRLDQDALRFLKDDLVEGIDQGVLLRILEDVHVLPL